MAKLCKNSVYAHSCDLEKKVLAAGDLGAFYRFVNSKLSCRTGIAPLMDVNGDYVLDNEAKANLLNSYFAKVCVHDNSIVPLLRNTVCNDSLSEVNFSSSTLMKLMSNQKSSLPAGPDGLPPLFYKKMASCLAGPCSKIYDAIFKCGNIPAIWKTAFVTPVFKKGKTSLAENYRPISLTCVACKLFESVIKSEMVSFLKDHSLLNSAQHGFVAGHSTTSNMLESLNDWTVNIMNGHYSRVAYIDFAKAFDSVVHSKLIVKCLSLGFSGNLIKIITSFLADRSQKVVIRNAISGSGKNRNAISGSENIISGVPQGSVLGPLLFVIFINDLSDVFPSSIVSKYFADDAKLYTEIKSGEDIDRLQHSLDDLSEWAEGWQLSIAIKKCCTMDITIGKNGGLTMIIGLMELRFKM